MPEQHITEIHSDYMPVREAGTTDALTELEISRIIGHLGALVLDETTVLAEHQQEAFVDIVNFFSGGGRECYSVSPTGSGKTVLFVELSRLFIEAASEDNIKPRVMVLEPSITLVNQTVGSVDPVTGKRRGFKGFAPDLDVRASHSHMSHKDQVTGLQEGEVLVTTYNAFRNIIDSIDEAKAKTPEEWDIERDSNDNNIAQAKHELGALGAARANYIRSTYVNQEVKRVRNDAQQLLRESRRTGEFKEHRADLEELINLSKAAAPKSVVLSMLRKKMHNLAPRGFTTGQGRPRKAQTTKDQDKADTQSPLLSTPVQKELEEGDAFLGYSNYEQFILRFLSRHRRGVQPKRSDLLDFDNRIQVDEYTDQMRNIRSKIHHYRNIAKSIERMKALSTSVDDFNLLILDEAHRAIGTETWDAIQEYAQRKGIAIIGLTATDKYYDRHLEDYFEEKAHELTKQEAIRRQITNPVALFVHDTGLNFGNIGLDASGDYDRVSLNQVRNNYERNMLAVSDAKMLSELGYFGIMSAIPGNNGAHAKVLASMLNEQEFIDPATGEQRQLRAKYILGTTPIEQQQSYFEAFERGELDWLVFIDVIREGWDSDRAKALINTRLTRSLLLAIQRLGRVGRTHEGAQVSILIDLHDGVKAEIDNTEIPPVLGVDVFEVDNVEQGFVVGPQTLDTPALAALRQKMSGTIEAHHTRFIALLEEAYEISASGVILRDDKTQTLTPEGRSRPGLRGTRTQRTTHEWQTFEMLQKAFNGYLPKELLLDAVNAATPLVRAARGRRGPILTPLFNPHDVHRLHNDKPEVNPWKLHVDDHGQKWITPEGCVKLLSKRFPGMQPQQISDAIRTLEADSDQAFEKSVGRVRLAFRDDAVTRMGLTHLYKLEEVTERLVPYLLATN